MQPTDIPPRVVRRLFTNSYDLLPAGCIVSNYATGAYGYAQIGWMTGGVRVMASVHRAAWLIKRGPIPEDLTVDHICKNKKCINVEHMRLLTNFENARRTYGRDWPLGQCANGHSNDHLGPVPGKKIGACLICYRESWTTKNQRRRA